MAVNSTLDYRLKWKTSWPAVWIYIVYWAVGLTWLVGQNLKGQALKDRG